MNKITLFLDGLKQRLMDKTDVLFPNLCIFLAAQAEHGISILTFYRQTIFPKSYPQALELEQ